MKKPGPGRKLGIAVLSVFGACLFAATVGLLFFRPQLRALYYRLRERAAAPPAVYRRYDDPDGKLVIWLDPGHGGSDPGATSPFLGEETESSVNLRLALMVKAGLEAGGCTVRLTWDETAPTDEQGQYPYQERIARANADPEADLYLCLHANSFSDPAVGGGRLYYASDRSPYNHYLALSVADAVAAAHGGEDRPRLFPQTGQAAIYVLRNADMPALLLETLFVSNEEDAAKLLDPAWLSAEAEGIVAGVCAFLNPDPE